MQRRSKGIALVSVLWLLVLLTTIAVALTATVRSEVRAVGNTVDMTKARYAAQAGVELGVLNLLGSASAALAGRWQCARTGAKRHYAADRNSRRSRQD